MDRPERTIRRNRSRPPLNSSRLPRSGRVPRAPSAGSSVKVVQARLGHASATETLDTYAHLWPDDEDQTRAAVQSAMEAR